MLLSDQVDAQHWWKRTETRLHLAMCRLCSRLARQLLQLREGARRNFERDASDPGFEKRLARRLSAK